MPKFSISETETVSLYGISFAFEYLYALAIGAVVLLFFAYRQLNRPSYELDAEQLRIFTNLMPADIGGGAAFFRAYAFYAITLLVTFLLFSIFIPLIPGGSDIFGLETIGFDSPTPEFESSTLPLIVSLAMVGLGPSLPILENVEESFRRIAHRLVGIPDNILDIAQRIRQVEPNAEKAINDEVAAFKAAAEILDSATISNDPNPKEIADLITHVFLARSWLFSYSFSNRWPPQSIRSRFSHSFEMLQRDIDDSLSFAVEVSGEAQNILRKYEGESAPTSADAELKKDAQRYILSKWGEVRAKAYKAWMGSSTLIALYAINAPTIGAVNSHILLDTIMTARASRQRPVLDIIAKSIIVTFLLIFFVTIIASYLGLITSGRSEELTLEPIWTAILWSFSSLFIYLPASLAAWLRRGGKIRRMTWIYGKASLRNFPMVQYLGLFVVTYVMTLVSMVFFSVFVRYVLAADKTTVVTEYFSTNEITVTAVFSLLGALQGCFLCLWQDVTENRGKLALIMATLLAVFQALSFSAVSLIGELVQGKTIEEAIFIVVFSFVVGFLLGFVTIQSLGNYRESLENYSQ